ncbi:MAG: 50S ribosomal protein L22 [Terracidiphilus sp.]|jgi:large subunit ribosomal protein L22
MAVQTKEYRAEAKFQRVSPQKARLVLDLIKGRSVEEALNTAAFTRKRIAPVVYKLLASAVDNAKYVAGEEGIDLDVDHLYVKQAVANDGPRMKRIRPAPMGRAYRYQRRLTHIVVSLAEREAAAGLVTKVEEPAPTAAKVEKPKKAAPAATKAKKAAPKAEKGKAKATASKAEETKPAAKTAAATKKKAAKKA